VEARDRPTQHAFDQQVCHGANNFFVTFIAVMKDQDAKPVMVQDGVGSGDFLRCFWLGTRQASHEKGRKPVSLTIMDIFYSQLE